MSLRMVGFLAGSCFLRKMRYAVCPVLQARKRAWFCELRKADPRKGIFRQDGQDLQDKHFIGHRILNRESESSLSEHEHEHEKSPSEP
jgi:hypothetical protein